MKRVVGFTAALLLLAATMPVEAGGGNGAGSDEFCDKHPAHPRCVIEDICNIVVIHAGSPQIGVWDPVLGIVDFHPDQCYEYYVQADNERRHLFTYEPVY